jgi:hypothetical protein
MLNITMYNIIDKIIIFYFFQYKSTKNMQNIQNSFIEKHWKMNYNLYIYAHIK